MKSLFSEGERQSCALGADNKIADLMLENTNDPLAANIFTFAKG
jgi:hypothetical protein